MALKPDRHEMQQDISWYMNTVAERGGIVTVSTAGSGGGWKTVMGDTTNVVAYSATAANKSPIGILMNDMVAAATLNGITSTGKDEMPVGSKCTLLRKGWVVTNKILGTPVGGEPAYVGASGLITPTYASGSAQIGQFLGSKDEDGYARVSVLL